MRKYLLKISVMVIMIVTFTSTIVFANQSLIAIQDEPITRGEFVDQLVNIFGLDEDITVIESFTDVSKEYDYAKNIAIAKQCGIISGVGDNNFLPDEKIIKQDMYTMIARALWYVDKDLTVPNLALMYNDTAQISDYAKDPIRLLTDKGYIKGKNVEPLNNILYSQAQKLLKDICVNTEKILFKKLEQTTKTSNILSNHVSIQMDNKYSNSNSGFIDSTIYISGIPYTDYEYYEKYVDGYELLINKNNYMHITADNKVLNTSLNNKEYLDIFTNELENFIFTSYENEKIESVKQVNGLYIIDTIASMEHPEFDGLKEMFNVSDNMIYANKYYIDYNTFEVLAIYDSFINENGSIDIGSINIKYDVEYDFSDKMTHAIQNNLK